MKLEWKKIVGAVAPTLATALGGPLAGMAVRQISQAVLGKDDGTDEQIDAALMSAGPDVLAKIREADRAFAVKMRELDIDLEKVHADDRASARDREVKTGDVWTPRALASLVVVGFFACVGFVLAGAVEVSGEAGVLIGTLLGYVSAKADQVTSYYFGSSAGSKAKTDAMTHFGSKTR